MGFMKVSQICKRKSFTNHTRRQTWWTWPLAAVACSQARSVVNDRAGGSHASWTGLSAHSCRGWCSHTVQQGSCDAETSELLLLTPSLRVLPAQQDGFTDVKSDTLKYVVATDEPWNTPHTHTHVCVCKVDSAGDGKWWLRSFTPQNWPPCLRNAATICLFWCILSVKHAHAAHMEKLCKTRDTCQLWEGKSF